MSDQFPTSKNTPTMTVPGIIEWLAGEVEDLKAKHATETHRNVRNVIEGQWLYVEVLIAKLTDTAMRALDGDETAGRRMGGAKP
jgi:hypothetical protein